MRKIKSYNCLAKSEQHNLPILGFQLPSQDSADLDTSHGKQISLNLLEIDMREMDQDRTLTNLFHEGMPHLTIHAANHNRPHALHDFTCPFARAIRLRSKFTLKRRVN